MILLNFYIFAISLDILLFLIGLITKNKELILRMISIFVLVNVFTIVLMLGIGVFSSFMFILFILAVLELIKNYKANYFVFISYALVLFFVSIFYLPKIYNYIIPIFLSVALSTFFLSKQIVSKKIFLYVFISLMLVPSIVGFIMLYKFNLNYVILIVLLLQMNDGFGYLFGKLFGRTKIIPTSPNKSLEGYFFSLIGVIVGIILLHTIIPVLRGNNIFQDSILCLYIFVFGNIGDLIFSAIKRKMGVKDFGSIVPGQGGILDRIDSDLFVTPFFVAFLVKIIAN